MFVLSTPARALAACCRRRRARTIAGLVGIVGLGATPLAVGAPWPVFGGSSGRASFAALETGVPPLSLAWSATASEDQGVWTSPIVTQGARPLVAYGSQRPTWMAGPTSRGNVHLRDLLSGQPVGPQAGLDVDSGADDGDTFGSGNQASVPFVDTSAPGGPPGQLFVVHNDDGAGPDSDVAIAQIDEASGTIVRDVPVPGTPHFAPGGATGSGQNGSDVSGSPALDLDAAGNGSLVFRVGLPIYDSGGASVGKIENVHVVPITNARSPAAVIDTGAQRITPDFQATSRTSPTLVTLADPSDQGRPTTYIAMGTSERGGTHEVQTFRLRDLAPGPRSDDLAGWGLTVSVPVGSGGLAAGVPGSGVAVAPYLMVGTGARGTGRVYKLVQNGSRLAVEASATLPGYASPALALDAVAGAGAPGGGHVVLTTESNLYVLRASDLGEIARFSPATLRKGCAPCDSGTTPPPSAQTGFYTTTATIAAGHVYVERDDGSQLVLDVATAQPVAAAAFTQDPANAGSTFTRGQPAVGGGHVIFAGVRGVFAYRMTGGAFPSAAAAPPAGGAGTSAAASRLVLSSVRLSPTKFRAARSGRLLELHGRGARLAYRLSAAATLTVEIQRVSVGRRVGRRCLKARAGRKGKRCTRITKVATSSRLVRSGRGVLRLSGRAHGHALAHGPYRLVVGARDRAKRRASSSKRSFRILAR